MAMLPFLIGKAGILLSWTWKLEDNRQEKEGYWLIFERFYHKKNYHE